MLAGLAIVLVHRWAEPRIAEHRARALREAVTEVLGGPERFEARYVVDRRLVETLPAGADSASAATVYAGWDGEGGLVGYAVPGEKPGYQDVVRLIFGWDPRSDRVLGMKVLESKETPGLGSRIISDSAFVDEFRGVETPLVPVKEETGDAPRQVDMITGATVSSRTVVEIINARLEDLGPILRAHVGVGPTGGTGDAVAGGPGTGPTGRGEEGHVGGAGTRGGGAGR
jgi:electron transport complex protein RnfG